MSFNNDPFGDNHEIPQQLLGDVYQRGKNLVLRRGNVGLCDEIPRIKVLIHRIFNWDLFDQDPELCERLTITPEGMILINYDFGGQTYADQVLYPEVSFFMAQRDLDLNYRIYSICKCNNAFYMGYDLQLDVDYTKGTTQDVVTDPCISTPPSASDMLRVIEIAEQLP